MAAREITYVRADVHVHAACKRELYDLVQQFYSSTAVTPPLTQVGREISARRLGRMRPGRWFVALIFRPVRLVLFLRSW